MILLHELFIERAKQNPEKYAVVWDTDSKVFSTTYAQILAGSGIVLDNLISAGANSEYVGVLVECSMIYPTFVIGILRSSCAFVPINIEINLEWISQLIRKINIRFILTDNRKLLPEEWKVIKYFSVHHENVFLMCNDKTQRKFERRNLTMAYAIQTSGSTGIPKIIRVSHQSIVPNIVQLRSIFNVGPEDTIFLSSPFTFDPSVVEIFVAFYSGASLLTSPYYIRAAPGPFLFRFLFGKSRIYCGKVSILSVTPSYAACLLNTPSSVLTQNLDPCLKILSLGGEPCPPLSILYDWKNRLGGKAKIFSLYGITEVSCWASITEIELNNRKGTDEVVTQATVDKGDIQNDLGKCSVHRDGDSVEEAIDLPLGSPMSQTSMEVRDSEGSVITDGIGELYIGSETRVCLLDDEDISIAEKNGAIYRATGDIVKVCNSSNKTRPSISYLRRRDDVAKRFGRWILTKNIESLASGFVWDYQGLKHVSIEASCCVWCGSDFKRKKIALFIVPSDKETLNQSKAMRQNFVEDLMTFLYKRLPSNSWPDIILPIDNLPLTEHAKVNKVKLISLVEDFMTSKATKSTQRSDELLEHLQHLWMRYLNLRKEPTPDDKFLMSGGDSLLALRLISELEEDLNCVVPTMLLTVLLKGTYSEACACINSHFIETQCDNSKNTSCVPLAKRTQVEQIVPFEKKFKPTGSVSRIQDMNEEVLLCLEYRRGTVIKNISAAKLKPTVITNENLINFQIEWKYDLGKCVDASPVLLHHGSKSIVVVGSHSHLLVAVSAINGEKISSCELPDRIESSACFSMCGNFIFVGCYDHSLYSINIGDGSIIWSFATGNMIKSSPVIVKNGSAVVFGSYDEFLYCVKVQSGELIWKVKPGLGAIYSSQCLYIRNTKDADQTDVTSDKALASPGIVLTGTLGGTCAAVSELDGGILWSHEIQAPIFTSPLTFDGKALFSSVKGKVMCFSVETGKEIWCFQASGNTFSSFSYIETKEKEQFVVFGCHDHCLYCLNGDGELKWCTELDSPIFAIPFIYPVLVIGSSSIEQGESIWVTVTSTKGSIYVIEIGTGTIKGSMKINKEIFSSPIVFQNSIIFGCRDNYLYSLKMC